METGQQQTDMASMIPHETTLTHAATIGIKYDKPIMLDYYLFAKQKKCRLVKPQEKDTILYKSNQEYTSPLQKLFKIDSSQRSDGCDVLAISENSIYIVHSNIVG